MNLIPVLKYIPEFMPGGGFKKKAREYMQVTERFLHEPFNSLTRAMVSEYTLVFMLLFRFIYHHPSLLRRAWVSSRIAEMQVHR